jgi:hypothetical protein
MKARINRPNEEIKQLTEEIKTLEDTPEKLLPGASRPDPFTIYLGAFLAVVLSLCLYFFYVTTGYEAFFDNPLSDSDAMLGFEEGDLSGLFPTIFDPKALGNAVADANVYLLLFPFIFLSLGFVLHKFYESKKWYFAVAILMFTFAFDTLLAYKIGEKAHQMKIMFELVEGDWTLIRAMKDPNFLAIIFAGFVVYVIWSLLLNICFKAHQNPVYSAIAKRQEQIAKCKYEIASRLDRWREEKANIEQQIEQNKTQIETCRAMVNGKIISWQALEKRLDTFASGWLSYIIQSSSSESDIEEKTSTVSSVVDQFKQEFLDRFREGSETEEVIIP